MKHKVKWSKFPVAVTLHFVSDSERERFMGQLSDGWGEKECNLDWDYTADETGYTEDFDKVSDYAVTVFKEDE